MAALVFFLLVWTARGLFHSASNAHRISTENTLLNALSASDRAPADCICADRSLCDRIRVSHDKEARYLQTFQVCLGVSHPGLPAFLALAVLRLHLPLHKEFQALQLDSHHSCGMACEWASVAEHLHSYFPSEVVQHLHQDTVMTLWYV
jgi:hypothetical protein